MVVSHRRQAIDDDDLTNLVSHIRQGRGPIASIRPRRDPCTESGCRTMREFDPATP